jgi:hypothetical protein
MTEHHLLAGKFAVHPAAFFQNTDPALDAANFVGPGKWWVDSGNGNALKVRNDANDAWVTVVAGAGQAGIAWNTRNYIYEHADWVNADIDEFAQWTNRTYV